VYDRAIALIDADPSGAHSSGWLRGQRAPCLARAGQVARAEQELRESLKDMEDSNEPESPWLADSVLPIVSILNDTGRFDEARAMAERVQRLWPGKVGTKAALAHYEIGRSLQTTDPAAARAAFLRARDALGMALDQCRLGEDVRRALGEVPRTRSLAHL
jgi:tetratricopeptide (TPR) repeat protein